MYNQLEEMINMEIRKKINISLKDYFLFNVSLMKKNIIKELFIMKFHVQNGKNMEVNQLFIKILN